MSIDPEIVNNRNNQMGAEHGIPSGEREERGLAVMPEPQLPALPQELSIEQVRARVDKMRQLTKELMVENIHYGVIPGTERKDRNGKDISKRTLLKAGAELICMTFMLDPEYRHEVLRDPQHPKHREIISTCTLYHIPTRHRVASGEGSCSTFESKYAERRSSATCPECDHELMRSKYADKQTGEKGWYCNTGRGGCGANFGLKDSRIKEGGDSVENPHLADTWNTVLKMANKRSLVDAAIKAVAASEAYTQDLEDLEHDEEEDAGGEHKSSRVQSRQVDSKPTQRSQPPKPEPQTTASKTSEPPQEEKPAETAKPPTDTPAGVGPPLSQGHLNLLKKMLQNAHLIEDDNMTINTMSWLGEQFHLEVEFDDQKSTDENLVALLRRIPISKVAEVRAAITAKASEANTGA